MRPLLDSMTEWMNMNLSKLQEIVKDKEAHYIIYSHVTNYYWTLITSNNKYLHLTVSSAT